MYLKLEKKEEILIKIFLFVFVLILFIRSLWGPMWYDDSETGWVAEFDSVALPIISLQYRGSFFPNESDIVQAREDFPILYDGVYNYDDLRANKLIKVTSDKWMPFYFPVYSFLCLPVKVVLQILNINQDRCFLLTNSILIAVALYMVACRLKTSGLHRMFALIMFILSPIYYYNSLISYESCMFALVTIGMVMYANQKRNISAAVISIAGMMNTGILAVAIVMIIEYLVKIIKSESNFKALIINHWKVTLQYALCFTPALVYPILQKIYLKEMIFTKFMDYTWWLERIKTYLFDFSIGFPSFTMGIWVFLIITIISVLRYKGGGYKSLVWLLFLIGSISLISLHYHINSGMILCARYVMWTYPIILIYLSTIGIDFFKTTKIRTCVYSFVVLSSVVLMWVNHENALCLSKPNLTTKWIMDNIPSLYNPYYATFYCRVVDVHPEDNCYTCQNPGFYLDTSTGDIRKIIYYGNENAEQLVIDQISGGKESIEYIKKYIKAHENDEKYHYINISPWSKYKIKLKGT